MSILAADYTDCSVFIYDTDGNPVSNVQIKEHDKRSKLIRVALLPDQLKANDECRLMILTEPTPVEYQGKVRKIGGAFYIAMFQGQVRAGRVARRYKLNTLAVIDAYLCETQTFEMHSPVKVKLINISSYGVRFRAPFYSLNVGDRFRMSLNISGKQKKLYAETINNLDKKDVHSDYGCRFLTL